MAKYLEIAEQFVREYKERRRLEQADRGGSVSPEGNSRTSQNAEWEEGGGSDGSEGFGGAPSPESQNIGLPWPTYNDGKQFCCERCGVRFDTSAGFAKHRVYGCDKPPARAGASQGYAEGVRPAAATTYTARRTEA